MEKTTRSSGTTKRRNLNTTRNQPGTAQEVVNAGKDKRTLREKGERPELRVSKRRTGLVEVAPDTPGYRLLALLFQKISERNLLIKDAAEEIGNMTPGYLTHLRNGTNPITNVSHDVLARIARFVEIPFVTALLLADILQAKDYYLPNVQRLDEDVNNALRYIRTDAEWGGFMPDEVLDGSLALRQFVVLAYEKATGRRLVNGKVNLPALIGELMAEEAKK